MLAEFKEDAGDRLNPNFLLQKFLTLQAYETTCPQNELTLLLFLALLPFCFLNDGSLDLALLDS